MTDAPHFPRQALIDSHGGGGFRFAGMSHRGSLLCLPDGVWAWPVTAPSEIGDAALSVIFTHANDLDFFIVGAGATPWIMPEPLRERFRQAHISADVMMTGPAVRTYNIMLMESRRVGAGLIAVD